MKKASTYRHLPMRLLFPLMLVTPGFSGVGLAAPGSSSPDHELASFSAFASADADRLAGGEIDAKTGGLMSLPRGLFVQTLFVVSAPVDQTRVKLRDWDPVPNKALKVFRHGETDHIQDLWPDNPSASVQWLIRKTLGLKPGAGTFNLSQSEESAMIAAVGPMAQAPEADQARATADAWRQVLSRRVSAGPLQQPPYEAGDFRLTSQKEMSLLLAEEPGIANQFSGLIGQMRTLTPEGNYWELFELTGTGKSAVDLGAIYAVPKNGGFQMADWQYFSSAGIYVSLTLYQLWPVQVQGKPATLVWRGDFISAPEIALTRGVERIVTGQVMLQEIKEAIGFFRKDAVAP